MRIALITRTEFGWAAFLALAFAIIVDFFSIGSRLRSGARHIKNRLAERSAEKIKERIKALEKQRDQYISFTTSDKGLYLHTFQLLMGILMFITFGMMAVAAEVLVANEEGLRKLLFMTSVLVFCAATAVVFQGFKVTSWDTKDKLMVQVASLDKDIEGLRRKIGRRG